MGRLLSRRQSGVLTSAVFPVVCLFLFSGTLRSLQAETFRLNYDLQSTDVPGDQLQGLQEFASSHKERYLLLHGFACDTGGFLVSIKIADTRARKAQIALLNAIDPDRVRMSLPTVMPGEPRVDHRKLTLTAFNTREELDKEIAIQNGETLEMHRVFGNVRTEVSSTETSSEQQGVTEPTNNRAWLWLVLALLLVAIIVIYFLFFRKSKLERHTLNPEEAAQLTALTGETVIPSEQKGPRVTAAAIINEIIPTRRDSMALKKKSKGGPTPIIRKAVDKAFENKTLSELAKSPVHALQGLTPRHSKMLEEAFGIKTIEDLASLRYFEMAKAIAILSRYE